MATASKDSIEKQLIQIRRIAEHRELDAEKKIRKLYKDLLKDLKQFIGYEYAGLAKNGELTYEVLAEKQYYARFLEEVQQRVDGIMPDVQQEITELVSDVYAVSYNGMTKAVTAATPEALRQSLGGLDYVLPEQVRAGVNNDLIEKIVLKETLEKNRQQVIYNLKREINIGLTNGDRVNTMASRISKTLDNDYKKAVTVARTETHRVREEGFCGSAKTFDDQLKNLNAGVRMVKIWRTMKDERVRPNRGRGKKPAKRGANHVIMEGQTVLEDELFTLSDGSKTAAPGLSGVAAQDINCRCYLRHTLMTDEDFFSATGRHFPKNNLNEGFTSTGNSDIITAKDTSNFDELANYLDSVHGVKIEDSVKKLNFTTVRSAIEGVETVISEYPDVGILLDKVITSTSGVMSCSGTKISFNPRYFKDSQQLLNICKQQSAHGHWIPNSSPISIGVHEAAHGVEWALIEANSSYIYDVEKRLAWNGCSEAKKIVSQACKNIKKTSYGKGKRNAQLIQSISKYASATASETMAEAFADVYANGENANPLSIEIKRLTKDQMKKYKGAI